MDHTLLVLLLGFVLEAVVNATVIATGGRGTWSSNGSYEYYMSTSGVSKSYDDAQAYCEERHGHLAYVKTSEVQNFLQTLATDDGMSGHPYAFYVGLRDVDGDGTYSWDDGTRMDYSNWKLEEPDNFGVEKCVVLGHRYTYSANLPWYTNVCTVGGGHGPFGFICQRRTGRFWSKWGSWSDCDTSGSQARTRTCVGSGQTGPTNCTDFSGSEYCALKTEEKGCAAPTTMRVTSSGHTTVEPTGGTTTVSARFSSHSEEATATSTVSQDVTKTNVQTSSAHDSTSASTTDDAIKHYSSTLSFVSVSVDESFIFNTGSTTSSAVVGGPSMFDGRSFMTGFAVGFSIPLLVLIGVLVKLKQVMAKKSEASPAKQDDKSEVHQPHMYQYITSEASGNAESHKMDDIIPYEYEEYVKPNSPKLEEAAGYQQAVLQAPLPGSENPSQLPTLPARLLPRTPFKANDNETSMDTISPYEYEEGYVKPNNPQLEETVGYQQAIAHASLPGPNKALPLKGLLARSLQKAPLELNGSTTGAEIFPYVYEDGYVSLDPARSEDRREYQQASSEYQEGYVNPDSLQLEETEGYQRAITHASIKSSQENAQATSSDRAGAYEPYEE